MKKLTFCVLATCFMLSIIPTQIKAASIAEATKTSTIATETAPGTAPLAEIKSIDLTKLSTSENKEVLKEASPLANVQDRHHGGYNNRHANRDVDVTIQSDRSYGHHHGGAYIGGGGVIILIIILILVL